MVRLFYSSRLLPLEVWLSNFWSRVYIRTSGKRPRVSLWPSGALSKDENSSTFEKWAHDVGRHDEEEVGIRGRHADGGLHHNKNNIEVKTMLPTVLMFSLPMVERFYS